MQAAGELDIPMYMRSFAYQGIDPAGFVSRVNILPPPTVEAYQITATA